MSLENKLGKAGNCMSTLCLIHCVAFPLIAGILPAIGMSFLLTGFAEHAIIWSAIGFSALGMCWGYHKHRKLKLFILPFFLLLLAIGYFQLAAISPNHVLLMILGGLTLAMGNFLNRKFCKKCDSCHPH